MTPIFLGEAMIACIACGSHANLVSLGLTTLEVEDDESLKIEGLRDIEQVGVVQYPCGHTVCTKELAPRVAEMLNEHEQYNVVHLDAISHMYDVEEYGT